MINDLINSRVSSDRREDMQDAGAHSGTALRKRLPSWQDSVLFSFSTLEKLSSRYPGPTLGTWPMVQHCKTNTTNKTKQEAPQLALLPDAPAAPPLPQPARGALGADGCSLMGGKGSNLSRQRVRDPPRAQDAPSCARAQPQTPASQPWVRSGMMPPSLAPGRYSGYEFPLKVEDVYDKSEVLADAARLLLSPFSRRCSGLMGSSGQASCSVRGLVQSCSHQPDPRQGSEFGKSTDSFVRGDQQFINLKVTSPKLHLSLGLVQAGEDRGCCGSPFVTWLR